MNNKIDCTKIYNRILKNIQYDMKNINKPESMVVYFATDNYATHKYIELKKKTFVECGIDMKVFDVRDESNETDIRESYYCPYIMQLPFEDEEFYDSINYNSSGIDLDAFYTTREYIERLDISDMLPATVQAVLEILKQEIGDITGKKIAVVGCRSKTVGKFLGDIFLNKNATVSLYHSKSIIKDNEFEGYDVVISCVGKHGLISQKHFGNTTGCVCIDVGISRGEDGRPKGDFDTDIREHQRYTPYVNGVGLLTRICLARNYILSQLYKM